MTAAKQGRIVIFSGPGGVGKSTVCNKLLARDEFVPSVSATTRAPRGQEQDGVHYHFLAKDEFERRVAAGEFLEWAQVHGNCYGTLAGPVCEALRDGKHVILDIDVQGAEILRERNLEPVTIFLRPPDLEVLERRLRERGDTPEEDITKRLKAAQQEMDQAWRFDKVVVNDDLDRAVNEITGFLAGL